MFGRLWASIGNVLGGVRRRTGGKLFEVFSPIGALSRDIPSGLLAIWTSALLAIVLLIAYLAP
jgi:multicomponent Na+:H+ antiporter subunit D